MFYFPFFHLSDVFHRAISMQKFIYDAKRFLLFPIMIILNKSINAVSAMWILKCFAPRWIWYHPLKSHRLIDHKNQFLVIIYTIVWWLCREFAWMGNYLGKRYDAVKWSGSIQCKRYVEIVRGQKIHLRLIVRMEKWRHRDLVWV